MRIAVIVVLLSLALLEAHSQNRTSAGRVYELHTRIPLPEIVIRNTSNGHSARTDSTGYFRNEAGINDLLVFSGFSYQNDSILVIDHAEREVFLRPTVHQLNEVTVSSAAPRLGELRHPEFHGQTVVYQRDDNGFFKGGLAFRISYWNKDTKKERRAHKRLKQAELQSEIYTLFSPIEMAKYIPLKGQDLQNFIDLYRPSVDMYRSGEFNLLLYLNEKYREYLALPEDKRRLPPLKGF
jgi:hypothetical protein